MVTIESQTERREGVTLVTATIRAAAGPTRVTVAATLDGPVWPPRRQGEPAAGWECGEGTESPATFEGVVPEDGPLAIGFASPAPPGGSPLAVTEVAPATNGQATGETDGMTTPAAVLRGLGDPSPPSLIETEESPSESPVEDEDVEEVATAEVGVGTPDAIDPSDARGSDAAPATKRDSTLPPELAAWLDEREGRIECAEALEATASVAAATEALRECGGVDGARSLDARLATDAEHLRTLAKRATALAERAESTAVATDALERLS